MSHKPTKPSPDTPNHHRVPSARRLVTLAVAVGVGLALTGLSVPRAAWAAGQQRAVSGFQAVSLEGSFAVKVELAERESVRVTGSDKAQESIETLVETRQGVPTLVLRQKSSWTTWPIGKREPPETVVFVQGPRFDSLTVAGSGDLDARLSNQPAIKLSVAGSGDLRLQGLTAHKVDVNVAGSGDVRVQGAAQNLTVSVAGSGDAWLRELEAEDVRVNVAGSGDARVNARQRLRVNVAGSGDVRYTGAAKDVSSSVMGSGTVKRD
ncbi:MAG: hypothetical protein RL500_1046 [Pseudomonadota bacterium]